VRAEHQPDGRAVEAVGLAQLVHQEAAVGVADVAAWLVLMKTVGGRTLAWVAK
jgi:hypothetical protein